MKTTTMWVMAIALVAATSCSETETDVIDSGDDDQIALGITPNLRVEAGTKSATKSVVSGDAITYTNYTDDAPGLGVLITNEAVNGWYVPDGTDYTGHHVWYMGDEKGANWISIQEKGVTFDDTDESPYYLTKEIGKVYAYYPYDAAITKTLTNVSAEADLKIPVTVLSSGEINAQRNNAKKYWNAGAWASTARADLANLCLPAEKDYLYFAAEGGRYVNNGRADGFSPVTPEDEPDNLGTDNPGYKINLDMKHAMAMVSFRVYDGGRLSDNDVNFTKFTIKNHAGGTNLFKTGSGKMSLTDGTITETITTTELSRTITNYVLMRQVEAGEGEHAFIKTGTTTSGINGKTVSKSVSAIVYPVTFGENEIDLEITLKEGNNPPVVYPVTLVGNQWEPNNNYIYTLSAGRNKLTVMDVSVEPWVDNEQDEIPL
ncbi:fimbrillin family protein [Parabacteroides sp. HGS0025]|uniref:fimbrillin family protein n=1 Tax=Parabacteroides sp. HGS0025 TaxID=1078087 RepID=UPI00061723C9|nr:fimbrillin family protein [Parabacteroides sp. HGS0025]KKB51877.1 hypothetical protein HMPREF1212_02615 [Parabacteroides sp. HGS0025]